MEQKLIRAFGYIFAQNIYEQGYQHKLIPNDTITCTIFCSRGYVESKNAETGEPAQDNYAGCMFKSSDFIFKEYDLNVIEPTVVYCYDELMNNGVKLNLEPVDIPQGQETIFSDGTKFLLCEGTLFINDSKFTAPSAISITTGDKVIVPETRCLGIKVL